MMVFCSGTVNIFKHWVFKCVLPLSYVLVASSWALQRQLVCEEPRANNIKNALETNNIFARYLRYLFCFSKTKLTPWCHLSWLLSYSETQREPSQTSKKESFATIVNDFQSLTIVAKSAILDVCGSWLRLCYSSLPHLTLNNILKLHMWQNIQSWPWKNLRKTVKFPEGSL